jgi:hypothetical protein
MLYSFQINRIDLAHKPYIDQTDHRTPSSFPHDSNNIGDIHLLGIHGSSHLKHHA